MKRLILIVTLSFIPASIYSQEYLRLTNAIDTPTAFTIPRGTYQIDFFGYERGGIEIKTFIGLHDAFFLGASEDVEHAIGNEKAVPNIPGVVGKAKLTDGWETFPISIAVGYESFYIGSNGKYENNNNKYNRTIFGPYIVFTKPIYLFNDEQHFSFGIRTPVLPKFVSKDTSYFLSFCLPLGRNFVFMTETERIYYNFSRSKDWLLNFGLRANLQSRVGLEFDVIKQRHQHWNRIIKVEYKNEF